MGDSSSFVDLLDRAGNVFSLAGKLGRGFSEEHQRRGQTDAAGWNRHAPDFKKFCTELADLRHAIENPPDGFAPVAAQLLGAAIIAKGIRDKLARDGNLTAYLDHFPDLNTVSQAGWASIEEVRQARRVEDPLAFADQTAGEQPRINTTPTLPKPPATLIEAAGRAIPTVLANVPPNHEGAIELTASHLAQRLNDAGHTLAAAHWAIHEAILSGRLKAGPVEMECPSFGRMVGGHMAWSGGHRGTIAIPKGKPAPSDAFKVTATELLWAWWRNPAANGASGGGTEDVDVELLLACGLPAEPAADVREWFQRAVRLLRRGPRYYGEAAVALAKAIGRAGVEKLESLPFGYDGPRIEHVGWVLRETLTRALAQLGALVAGARLDAEAARRAVDRALREYWLRAEPYDTWRPGMTSGSGNTEAIRPEPAGIARVAEMAAELTAVARAMPLPVESIRDESNQQPHAEEQNLETPLEDDHCAALATVAKLLQHYNAAGPSETGREVEDIPRGCELHKAVDSLQRFYGRTLPRPAITLWRKLLSLARAGDERADDAANNLLEWVLGELKKPGARMGPPAAAGEGSEGVAARRPSLSKAEANRLAIPYLEKHPRATAKELSNAIGCAQGQVPKLPAWRAVVKARREGRTPKVVGLTSGHLAATPDRGAELARLAAEQEADDKSYKVHRKL